MEQPPLVRNTDRQRPQLERRIRIMLTKMSDLAVLLAKKRQNILKVRVGQGTCPRVPLLTTGRDYGMMDCSMKQYKVQI